MKTRNVHWGGTTHCVDRLTSRKAQAALALAVSLWIANGGVASADEQVSVDTTETVSTDKSGTTYILNQKAGSDGSKGSGVKFTVAAGGTVKKLMVSLGVAAATPSSSRRAARLRVVENTASSAACRTTK